MPNLVRLFIRNYAVGFGLALVFSAGLIALDVAHLRHLVLHVQGGYLAAFLLFFFSGIVFAGAQVGIAVMSMAEDDGPARPKGGRLVPASRPALEHLAVPVRVRDR